MNREKLRVAVQEAMRFIERVDELPPPSPKGAYYDNNHPKESGAIRRASMDLTRALANLRKSS